MTIDQNPLSGNGRFVGVGASAGVFSALTFTVVHQLIISSIWFAFPAMVVAGAVCGLCLAWSYLLVTRTPSASTWLRYNLGYLAMFLALGAVSVATFDPVTTIAALLETNQPPTELIGRALPMTGGFTLGTAVLLSVLYRPSWSGALSLFVTTSVLVLLLGLNISVLGLVGVPHAEFRVLAETFGLLVLLGGVYTIAVILLAPGLLSRRRSA